MKSSVIVTVNIDNNGYTYDVEVPTDVPCGKLSKDLVTSLSVYSGWSDDSIMTKRLYSPRLKRFLDDGETFGTAGIWNGDIITIN